MPRRIAVGRLARDAFRGRRALLAGDERRPRRRRHRRGRPHRMRAGRASSRAAAARVIVLERAEPGAEASGAAAGMLSPQSDARVAATRSSTSPSRAARLYPAWARELAEETGIDVGFRRTGLAALPFRRRSRDAGLADVFALAAGARAAGRSSRPERGARGAARRPPVRGRARAASSFRTRASSIRAPLTRAAWLGGDAPGREVRTGRPVRGFRIEGGVVPRRRDRRGRRSRPTRRWTPPAPGRPSSGAASAAAARRARPRPDRASSRLGEPLPRRSWPPTTSTSCPRPDGTRPRRLDRRARRIPQGSHRRRRSTRLARGGAPSRSRARERRGSSTAWSGLAAGDRRTDWPVLGASPIRGLFFAAGHFRNGILLAPVDRQARRGRDLRDGRRPRSRGVLDRAVLAARRIAGSGRARTRDAISARIGSRSPARLSRCRRARSHAGARKGEDDNMRRAVYSGIRRAADGLWSVARAIDRRFPRAVLSAASGRRRRC